MDRGRSLTSLRKVRVGARAGFPSKWTWIHFARDLTSQQKVKSANLADGAFMVEVASCNIFSLF